MYNNYDTVQQLGNCAAMRMLYCNKYIVQYCADGHNSSHYTPQDKGRGRE